MIKKISLTTIFTLVLSGGGNAFIFDFFKSEKQKCLDELLENSYLREGENYNNSRDVRHIHCLCEGNDAEICDRKYYGD